MRGLAYEGDAAAHDIRTLLLGLVCLLGAAAGGYLLYEDLTAEGGRGAGSPIARVERLESRVRRKISTRYLWAPARENEDLYRKDSVQTGPASAATIRFNDGAVVELGEDSLVVIDNTTDLALNFVRGSAILRNDAGDVKITKAANGQAKVEKLPAQLIAPARFSGFHARGSEALPIGFQWKLDAAAAADSGLRLEISTDRAFAAPRTRSIPLEAGVSRHAEALKAGKYFWRIAGATPLSEPATFQVASVEPLNALGPARGERVLTRGTDTPVQFRWAAAAPAGEHVLEVANDPAFATVIARETVRAENGLAQLRGIPEGRFHWRLKSAYGELALEGQSRDFVVERARQLTVTPSVPVEKAAIELQPELRFVWSSDSPEAEYRMVLERLDTGGAGGAAAKEVHRHQGRASAAVWKAVAPGSYRWKVQALEQGQVAGEADWRGFTVFAGKPLAHKLPARGAAIHFWEKPPEVSFEWETDSRVEEGELSYRLEVASDAAFTKTLLDRKLKEPRAKVRELPSSDAPIYWRVSVIDAAGALAKTGAVSEFRYGRPPPLGAPGESRSESGDVHDYSQNRKDPVFRWSEVEEAQAYELTVQAVDSRAPASPRVAYQKIIRERSHAVPRLPEGQYLWTVRPIDRLERKGAATPTRRFVVSYGALLEAPEVTSSEVQ